MSLDGWSVWGINTCNDNDGSAKNVGEDEDVNVLQGVKLEAIATGNWRGHLHDLVPLLLPVLAQPHLHAGKINQDMKKRSVC